MAATPATPSDVDECRKDITEGPQCCDDFQTKEVQDSPRSPAQESDSVGSGDNLPLKSPEKTGKVMLLLGLNSRTTEEDISQVVAPFTDGRPGKIFVRAHVGQAWVEFKDELYCSKALAYFSQHPVSVKGSQLSASPSRRGHVTPSGNQITKVVLVSISNIVYRVELKTLCVIMSRWGVVEKIVTFMRNPMVFQALVQYRDKSEVEKAIANLHNRDMYEGCNSLQLVPSRLSEIIVTTNDKEKSWDFTIKPLDASTETEATLSTHNTHPNQSTFLQPWNHQSTFGMTPCFQQPQGVMRPLQSMALNSHGFRKTDVQMVPPTLTPFYDSLSRAEGVLSPIPTGPQRSAVIICYNIAHDRMDVQHVFNLFSLYGHVKRIKMLKDKPDTALVQFSHPMFAQLARSCLNESEAYGRQLQITSSKNWEIKMPSRMDGDEGSQKRTVEFLRRDQRYKLEQMHKYTRSACRPTATLLLANIGSGVTENDLVELVSTIAAPRSVSLQQGNSASNKKIAVMVMPSPSEAVEAVCSLHNHDFHGSNLKVAFSKSVLQ